MQNQNNIQDMVENQDRSIGKQIFYNRNLEKVLDKITDTAADVYNDSSLFNTYERLINRLERMVIGYIDEEYTEERIHLDTLPTTDIIEKVHKLDMRDALCMKLLKRKKFTPPEDVANTSFWIVRDIVNRIWDEYDAQVIVSGDRGTGKSTLAMELCRQIAEKMRLKFDPVKHLFFNPTDMRRYIAEEKPSPGQPIIWDEAGAGKGMGRRRAMTRESTEYNEIIQVIREMGLVMFYTAPAESKLDTSTVDMFSCQIETIRLDKLEKVNIVKYKIRDGRYWKYLTDSMGNRINRIIIQKAPEDMIKSYKPIKKRFMYEKVALSDDKPGKLKKPDVNSIKQMIRDNIGEYTRKWAGKTILEYDTIYYHFKPNGLAVIEAKQIKKELEAELNG